MRNLEIIEKKQSLEIQLNFLKFQLTTDGIDEERLEDLELEIEQIEEELETINN